MRKLLALAIVIMMANLSHSWAMVGLGDVKFDGSLEFGGYSAKNEEDYDNDDGGATNESDRRGEVVTRQRLGINGTVTENVGFRLELGRHDGQFGQDITGSANSSSSLQDEQNNIFVNNAYIDLINFLYGISARLGRQYVGNPGDLVWNISPRDTNNMDIEAIDGLLLQHRKCKIVQTDLFIGKLRENDGRGGTNAGDSSANDSDTNLNSLDFVFPNLVPGARLNFGRAWGVQEDTDNSSDSDKLEIWRLGINGGALENRLTYRAEYFMNGGEDKDTSANKTKYEGSAIDLGVGFNIPETPAGSFGINANWIMASGDDDTGDDKDKAFHDFSQLGFNTSDRYLGEIFGKSNTTSFGGAGIDTGAQGSGLDVMNLGLMWGPAFCPRSSLSLNWYSFKAVEDGANSANPNLDKYGSEMDLVWNFRHSDNVNAEFGYAMFSPDDLVTGGSGAPDDAITEIFSRLKVKWGDKGGGMTQIDPQ